jgi:hypothetical protein
MSNEQDKPKVAGQIITIGDQTAAVVGGTLKQLLDLDNSTEIDNGKVVREQKGPDTIIVGPKRQRERER